MARIPGTLSIVAGGAKAHVTVRGALLKRCVHDASYPTCWLPCPRASGPGVGSCSRLGSLVDNSAATGHGPVADPVTAAFPGWLLATTA
jgi:hypothetical protein